MTTKKKPATLKLGEMAAGDSEHLVGFPIIAIGASAGGLEALESFFANVPADSDMAFVVIQHQDPTRKGMLTELLQRTTEMKVAPVKDRMRVEPNHVYVIPSNKDMSILHGVLYLLNPAAPRGMRLPIDFFFRALAQDQQERAIGVVLSGMGSDGTLGARAIKEKAGAMFVQEPSSSQFDSMPSSVIEAGLADVIDIADTLPGKILAYIEHLPMVAKTEFVNQQTTHSSLEKIVILLRNHTGHDFSLYKTATVYRRIARRMALHQISQIADYVHFLQENPQERDFLFRELLIGVTGFFRDMQAWQQFESEVLPTLLTKRPEKQILRAWVPACSTGEEAYSLAILFREAVEKLAPTPNITLQIFATDLDQFAIAKAREGVFPKNLISEEVSQKRLERFFVKTENEGYRVSKSIREMIIFAPQNIIMDPPFTKLDILSCRNLLIYLVPELQKKLIPTFHYCLKPGGFLFLGTAETIGNFTDLFSSLPGKNQIFQRRETKLAAELIEFPTNFITSTSHEVSAKVAKPKANLQTLADSLILQTYAPAAVVTNNKGDILYISGRTGKYLEPAAGKANWNLFVMAREGLRYKLTTAFQDAVEQKQIITLKNVVVGTNGGKQFVNVTVQPVVESESALAGMVVIVFRDVSAPLRAKSTGKPRLDRPHMDALEQELEQARHEAQTIRAEMQKSQEELKSANEELQSTNEEIQSANEELTTSKEEMQSMNEELLTVNQELQTKLNELSRASNDMNNLLECIDIAILFLDNEMCVRLFTSQTSRITQLIPSDVGRPVTDISSALLYPELSEDAQKVLRSLVKVERQISLPSGEWFAVRILPYRTLENRIDGVVVTFTDITATKKLETPPPPVKG